MGIVRQTLSTWKKKYPEIDDALAVDRDQANALVENKLWGLAMKGQLTAIIFWLKNNDRDNYNDSTLKN